MNTLKKSALLIVVLTLSFTVYSQSKSFRIYDEYSGNKGFTFFSFSKAMIDAINLNIDEENKKVTGDLMEVRILIQVQGKNKGELTSAGTISDKFNRLNYNRIDTKDHSDNDDAEIWIEGNSKKIKECHVIIRNSEDHLLSCLVSFYGDFKVDDLESFEKFSRKQSEK